MLGEGSGALVLESEEHARARGARIYAEVLGAGITADAHDIAQPDPKGRGGSRAILAALAESGIGPESIFHVSRGIDAWGVLPHVHRVCSPV